MSTSEHNSVLPLYIALSPNQLEQVQNSDWRQLVASRSDDSYCYLKQRQRYAEMVARMSILPEFGAAYVLRLLLPLAAMRPFSLETVAYEEHLEYQVPVQALPTLTARLLGQLQLLTAFREQHSFSVRPGFAASYLR
ncbi:MAG: hypothetical protein ACK5ME_10705 [Parahaliea sp.]